MIHFTLSTWTRPVQVTDQDRCWYIEKNEMGGACGAYGVGERGAQGSGGET